MRDVTVVLKYEIPAIRNWHFNRKSHMHIKISLLSEFKSHIDLSPNDNFSKLERLPVMLFLIVSRSLHLEL